jgi:hypothetical protein
MLPCDGRVTILERKIAHSASLSLFKGEKEMFVASSFTVYVSSVATGDVLPLQVGVAMVVNH